MGSREDGNLFPCRLRICIRKWNGPDQLNPYHQDLNLFLSCRADTAVGDLTLTTFTQAFINSSSPEVKGLSPHITSLPSLEPQKCNSAKIWHHFSWSSVYGLEVLGEVDRHMFLFLFQKSLLTHHENRRLCFFPLVFMIFWPFYTGIGVYLGFSS